MTVKSVLTAEVPPRPAPRGACTYLLSLLCH